MRRANFPSSRGLAAPGGLVTFRLSERDSGSATKTLQRTKKAIVVATGCATRTRMPGIGSCWIISRGIEMVGVDPVRVLLCPSAHTGKSCSLMPELPAGRAEVLGSHEQIFGVNEQIPERGESDLKSTALRCLP